MRSITLILFVLCSAWCMAQPGKYTSTNKKAVSLYEKALIHYNARKDNDAKKALMQAIKTDPNFIEAHIVLSGIYEELKAHDEAIASMKKAIAINPTFYAETHYNLAKLEFNNAYYEDAVKHLEDYLKVPGRNPKVVPMAEEMLASAKFAKEAVKNPVPFKPINLGPNINTEDEEYLPTLTADEQTLIITRREPRKSNTAGKLNSLEEDFYISEKVDGKWGKAKNMGPPLNTRGNEGAQCISPDGQFFIFTGCERSDGFGSCDLYMSVKVGDQWSKPRNMGGRINSRQWDSQPSISSDGRTLYFTSTRPNGKGGADIWKSEVQADGSWGTPVNVEEINTSKNDISPFIHPDNITLYFSSSGHKGMGGPDIYLARKGANGKFGGLMNLGYPINTVGDQSSLIVSASGEMAYFASEKEGGEGKLDLYGFELYEEARPIKVTFTKGLVYDANTKKRLEARFELIDLATGDVVVESYSNPRSGEFLVSIPTNRDYALNVSRPDYLFFSKNFTVNSEGGKTDPFLMDVPLIPITETGTVVRLDNVFFDSGKYDLKKESEPELKKLAEFMRYNASIKIELGGHTDNVGKDEDNQILSENRARAVYNFLVDAGIAKERLSYKGYGETQPIHPNNATPEERAENRRTEFKVVGK